MLKELLLRSKKKILNVPIKPGIKAKTEIIFPDEGDQNPATIPG